MGKKKVVDESMSMKGWEVGAFAKGYFMGFLKGNWSTIKNIIKAAVPLALSLLATQDPALVAGMTVMGKGFLDIVEYFVSK